MKNPGSAAPQTIATPEELAELERFDNEKDRGMAWWRFGADQTMHCVVELFREYYGKKELSGVIQIFNLMNMRTPDAKSALKYMQQETEKDPHIQTIDDDIRQFVSPVYLGWGDWGASSLFNEAAKTILQAVCNLAPSCYQPEYDGNNYYHPQWLMRRAKKRPVGIEHLHKFCGQRVEQRELLSAPIYQHFVDF